MDQSMVGPEYVALVASRAPSKGEAARLVRRELAERGEKPWETMEIEVYPGQKGALIIARPSPAAQIYI